MSDECLVVHCMVLFLLTARRLCGGFVVVALHYHAGGGACSAREVHVCRTAYWNAAFLRCA